MSVTKAIRTLQSELWFLKEPKDFLYLWSRRLLRIPHEADFRALRLLRQPSPGDWRTVIASLAGALAG